MVNLQFFLNNNIIPKPKKRPKTFLGIAKQPHYENVLSNIYAFFFTMNEVHKMGDLFIKSLLEVALEKGVTKEFSNFYDFKCSTEVSTDKGGRIDILLSNDEQAIIIENKVYHHLNNDLPDYWKSTSPKSDTSKIGIVLSLDKIPVTGHSEFINITHLELLDKVMMLSGTYLLNANDKYITYLKDFYQNIINMSTKAIQFEDIAFYKANRDQIHLTARFLNRFKEYVKSEVDIACDILNGDDHFVELKGKSGSKYKYYQSLQNANLMFTISFDNLYRDDRKNIWVIVELKGSILKTRDIFKNIDFSKEELALIHPKFYKDSGTSYAHFALRNYSYDVIDFDNLRNFIVDRIKEDHLLSIFNKVNSYLSSQKNE